MIAWLSVKKYFPLICNCKLIISRNYRGDVDVSMIDKFMPLLMENEEAGLTSPIMRYGGVTFAYIQYNNLYGILLNETPEALAYVVGHFVLITVILLQLFFLSSVLVVCSTKKNANIAILFVALHKLVQANANGSVLQSEIIGSIKMRVYLSGMPELRLGLNDRVLFENTRRGRANSVELEDTKFHQCVRLSRFQNDRTISFIPPDGEFELMSYRLNMHIKPVIWIESIIERYAHSRVEYMVKAKSNFKRQSTANNVEVIVPVPSDADSPKFKTTIGNVTYYPEQAVIVWKIKSFPGEKEHLLRAHFGLPSVDSEETEGKPPIHVKFEIPYFITSGLQLRYLRITERSGYEAIPWVRYITQNGDYQLRTS